MRCGVNGSRVDMESSTTSSGRHCLLCPCASQVGQRRAEGDSCHGQRAKRRPASQLITKRHGWLMLLIFTFGYTEEEPTPFPEITVTSRNVARQEQHPKQDRHVLLAHSGQTQSPRDSEQGLYSLLLKQSRANGCWGFRAWESCWNLPPRHDHSPEEDVDCCAGFSLIKDGFCAGFSLVKDGFWTLDFVFSTVMPSTSHH